jgi:hypothetical protein
MKKLIYNIILCIIVSCSSEDQYKYDATLADETLGDKTKNEQNESYIYTLGEVMVKWIAFKHSSKAQVGGQFKSSIVEGFVESTNLYNSISGVSFRIPVNSTSTNDTVRDYKIVNSFFMTMVNTDFIEGKIISLNKNGTGKLSINMNNNEVEKNFKWEIDESTKEIYIKTAINVLNWGAQSSLNALNEVCLEQHTGPDGENVLWPNVEITVIVDL